MLEFIVVAIPIVIGVGLFWIHHCDDGRYYIKRPPLKSPPPPRIVNKYKKENE